MLPLQQRAPRSRFLRCMRCPARLELPLPRDQILKKVSLFFPPKVVVLFISIFVGEEEAVILVTGGGRSGGGQTTLSRSGEIQADTILKQILLGLNVTRLWSQRVLAPAV